MTTLEKLIKFEFHGRKIPEYMYPGIINYVDYGILPGHFLRGILFKDLVSCIDRADSENLWLIPLYYAFFYNEIPGNIWGNQINVIEHIRNTHEALEQ